MFCCHAPQCCLRVRDGVLILRGQLPSYYHKQIAQELLMQIAGVTRIENLIEVINPDSSTWLG